MSNLSTKTQGQTDLRSLLKSDNVKNQIALALPKHMDPDRMMRVALTACNKSPKLLECDQTSVLTALMTCSACGIEPDGRNAHLIPYGNQCQLIIDFKGYVILAKRNGLKNIHGDVVCENDTFIWKRTSKGLEFVHEFDFKKPRGPMYAAYVIWNEADGDFMGEIMQKDEVDAIRKRSRSGGSGPWSTDFNEMAKKTVIRRASKKWDITPEIRDAIEADDKQFERDVTPPATPTFTQPKHLGGIPLPEPASDSPPVPEPSATVGTEAEPVGAEGPTYTEEERLALLDEVNEARDAAGLTMQEFKHRVVGQGWAGVKDLVNKYPAETLVTIRDNWNLIVPSGE